jgi:hypothetical protein
LIADVRSFRWPTWENKQLKEMFEALDVYVAINCTGGAALTDFYPILQWLPAWLMPFKRLAMDHHDYVTKIYTNMYTSVRSRIIRGDSKVRPCVSNDVVTLQSKENFSNAYAAYLNSGKPAAKPPQPNSTASSKPSSSSLTSKQKASPNSTSSSAHTACLP